MVEFNKVEFEHLMDVASQRHRDGKYEEALVTGIDAYGMAPEDSSELGRAARDNAAHCDKLGRTDDAEQWAIDAFQIHNGIVESLADTPTREAYRERSASAMQIGVSGLRKVISARQAGHVIEADPTTIGRMRLALADLRSAKKLASGLNRFADQYEVNAARRVSIAETYLGNRAAGLVIGAKAVLLASVSESPLLDTSNQNSTIKQRFEAKKRALQGGLGAMAVNVLSSKKWRIGQQVALYVASRAL